MDELQPAVKDDFKSINLEGHTKKIAETIQKVKNDFMYIGFLLWEVNHFKYYEAKGYSSVVEYAEKELNFKQASTYNFISICEKFSEKRDSGYPTMHLDEKFKDFNFTQLVEIKSLKPEQLNSITPDMSKKQIREKKKELKSNDSSNSKIIDVEFDNVQEILTNNQISIDEVVPVKKNKSKDIDNLKVVDSIIEIDEEHKKIIEKQKENIIALNSQIEQFTDRNLKLVNENKELKEQIIEKSNQVALTEKQNFVPIIESTQIDVMKYLKDRLEVLMSLAKEVKKESIDRVKYLAGAYEVELLIDFVEKNGEDLFLD